MKILYYNDKHREEIECLYVLPAVDGENLPQVGKTTLLKNNAAYSLLEKNNSKKVSRSIDDMVNSFVSVPNTYVRVQ